MTHKEAKELTRDAMSHFFNSNNDDDNALINLYKLRWTNNREIEDIVYSIASEILMDYEFDNRIVAFNALYEELRPISLTN